MMTAADKPTVSVVSDGAVEAALASWLGPPPHGWDLTDPEQRSRVSEGLRGDFRAALAAAVPLLTADAIAAAFEAAADEVRDQYGYDDVRRSAVEEFLRRKARIARAGGTR